MRCLLKIFTEVCILYTWKSCYGVVRQAIEWARWHQFVGSHQQWMCVSTRVSCTCGMECIDCFHYRSFGRKPSHLTVIVWILISLCLKFVAKQEINSSPILCVCHDSVQLFSMHNITLIPRLASAQYDASGATFEPRWWTNLFMFMVWRTWGWGYIVIIIVPTSDLFPGSLSHAMVKLCGVERV